MNLFLVVILCAILFEYILEIVSNFLNLRALQINPPEPLKEVYEPEEYRRSQEYTRVNTRFGFITDTFKLVVLLVFWFAGGFNFVDQTILGLEFHVIVNGLLYIGVLILFNMFISIPFSLYGTFVIEERFGFNKTTPRTFIMDLLKGIGLATVIGGPLLAGILVFFEYAGEFAWFYAWIAATIFTFIIQFVAPTWIMPIFNKFDPLESGQLRDAIFNYADSVGFTIKNVFVIDGSKRSSKSNAFFTGFGRNKRIALFDTLVEKHTVTELVAILAHEIGHYKMRHIVQNLIVSIIHTGVIFYLISIVLKSTGLYDAFFMEHKSVYAGIIFFGLLYTPVEIVLGIIMNVISRKFEYEADRWSAETYQKPDSLIDALKKLSSNNLSNLSPHPLFVFLNYSHPTLMDRMNAINKTRNV